MGFLEVWQSGKPNPHGWVVQALTIQPGEAHQSLFICFLGFENIYQWIVYLPEKVFLRRHAVWHFDFQIFKTDKKSIIHFFLETESYIAQDVVEDDR